MQLPVPIYFPFVLGFSPSHDKYDHDVKEKGVDKKTHLQQDSTILLLIGHYYFVAAVPVS